ncbi:hypothetical protein BV898_01896 [Hypsibius exemplaris]|uniref:Uncharacterized protein n=1 Tax=Hypsibius exemplaris TaxID=2072580 RepID=A0A1W0XAC6_HYPEX|nr:hypothetical protein BV898_01896 [Hypsibius exemplaris]
MVLMRINSHGGCGQVLVMTDTGLEDSFRSNRICFTEDVNGRLALTSLRSRINMSTSVTEVEAVPARPTTTRRTWHDNDEDMAEEDNSAF